MKRFGARPAHPSERDSVPQTPQACAALAGQGLSERLSPTLSWFWTLKGGAMCMSFPRNASAGQALRALQELPNQPGSSGMQSSGRTLTRRSGA